MATEWDGKSRGTVFGFKIFIFFMKNFGINAAYALMHLPVPYFCLFTGKKARALYHYFRKRFHYSWFKSLVSIYKTYFVFGQTLIDKIAISAGLNKGYSYEFDGEELIHQVLKLNKGCILIIDHTCNFEFDQYFFKEQLTKVAIRY